MSRNTIETTPVESSLISEVGYDEATSTLAVKFHGKGKPGPTYHYRNVGSTEWAAMRDAKSIGGFFISRIKPLPGRYPFTRVDDAAPPESQYRELQADDLIEPSDEIHVDESWERIDSRPANTIFVGMPLIPGMRPMRRKVGEDE